MESIRHSFHIVDELANARLEYSPRQLNVFFFSDGSQLSIAANLLLVGIGVPVGFNAVMTSRGKEIAATRVAIDDKQIASDADQAILAALNERRDDDGLPRLCILPSQMTQEQLASAADADVSGASADDTHSGVLVHGVHVDAAPEWEVKLMKRCDELHAEALRRRADHQGLSHKTAGSVAKDPQEVLQEARRQGLDI